MSDQITFDPRPQVVTDGAGSRVLGSLCEGCGYPILDAAALCCPRCRSTDLGQAEFGPWGTVWSSTTIRFPLPGRTPPYDVAYVDLDDGPRLLVHIEGDGGAPVDSRVRLTGATESGDVRGSVEGTAPMERP
ncbi:Zn-ribbon domain-containing OB-fold protein [Pseudonocardia xishanensis]|uniref:ChsH2 C-terminal OB-fold domain-containing protein n=1 Tax=Pseudonocardia xishanensis TaxID=630995 RepID=A0ABP8RXM7_9PSEU